MYTTQSTANKKSFNKTLYTNYNNSYDYYYARAYQTDVVGENRSLTNDANTYTNVMITGVPDGVSPIANEAMIMRDSPRRLYIYSNKPLDESYLATIDDFYGRAPFPIATAQTPCGQLSGLPRNNFYLVADGPPTCVSDLVEYRYLQQRHQITNIAYDSGSGKIYKYVPPPMHEHLMVIVMPKNFIRTNLKCGYFRFDNGLIIRVFSNHILSSELYDNNDSNETTRLDRGQQMLLLALRRLFNTLGMTQIVETNKGKTLYAYDNHLTMVVGSLSNIMLPSITM
jgi:hypothetical protein